MIRSGRADAREHESEDQQSKVDKDADKVP